MENKQIDIKTITLVELKAIAYDLITQINYLQQQMNIVQIELNERSKQPKQQIETNNVLPNMTNELPGSIKE